METLAAATGIMTDAGLAGEQAGTSLRMSLIRLSDPPKEAAEAISELGIKITDAKGNMLPFDNIIQQLADSTKGMGNAAKLAALSTIFGAEAASGMLTIIDAGPDKLRKFTKELENSEGSAQKTAKAMKDNLKGAVEELGGAFETLMITMGTALTPAIKAITVAITSLVNWFNKLSKPLKSAITIGAALTGVLLLILGPILMLVAVIPSIIAGFTAIAGVVGLTAGALAGVIGIALGVVAVIVAIGIGLVIAYKKVEWFRKGVDYAWDKIKQSFNSFLKVAKVVLEGVVTYLKTAVSFWKAVVMGDWSKAQEMFIKMFADAWSSLKTLASTYLSELKSVWGKELSALKTIITDWFVDQKDAITSKLSEWKTAITDWFASIPGVIESKIAEWGAAISTWFTDKKTEIVSKLNEWKTAIIAWFESLPSVITQLLIGWGEAIKAWSEAQNEENKRQFSEWGKSIAEWFTSTKDDIVAKLGEWWTAISEWFTSIPEKISTALSNWWTAIGDWFTSAKDKITAKLTEWGTAISTWFNERPQAIGKELAQWWNKISTWFSEIPAKITAKLEEWWTAIKNWFTAVPNKPEVKNAGKKMIDKVAEGNNEKKKEFMDKLGKLIVDAITAALAIAAIAAIAAGREIIKRLIDGIMWMKTELGNKVNEMKDNVVKKFKEIDLFQVGKDIISGLKGGLADAAGGLFSKAASIARSVTETIKGAFNINSPSRVMNKEVGRFLPPGIAEGMLANLDVVKKAANTMVNAAIPEIPQPSTGYSAQRVSSGAQSQPAVTNNSPVNVTLNYSGSASRDDAQEMLRFVSEGLAQELRSEARLSGVKLG